MNNKMIIKNWTNLMEELVNSDLPLKECLMAIKDLRGLNPSLRKLSQEILFSLESGASFFFTLNNIQNADFPPWYKGIIQVCEECGSLKKTFSFLKSVLEESSENRRKLCFNILYPLFLMFLTIILAYFLQQNFGGTGFSKTLLFLLSACGIYLIAVKKLFSENPVLIFLKAMSFLWESRIPLERSIKTAANCLERNSKLYDCVSEISEELLDGQNVALSFEKKFEDFGFQKEGKIISMNLSLILSGSQSSPFEKSYATLKNKFTEKINIFFKFQQPFLYLASAIAILLACGNMDFLFGGLK